MRVVYVCKAYDWNILRTCNHVSVRPLITPFSFGASAANSGQFIQQSCIISEGDIPLTISWLLNSADASKSAGVNVFKMGSRTSILSIESVKAYHWGNYTCIAQNAAGTNSFTASLIVKGKSKSIYIFWSILCVWIFRSTYIIFCCYPSFNPG